MTIDDPEPLKPSYLLSNPDGTITVRGMVVNLLQRAVEDWVCVLKPKELRKTSDLDGMVEMLQRYLDEDRQL